MQVDNKIGNGEIKFHRVPNGEIFLYEDAYYLAIDSLEDSRGDTINAINLSEGNGEGTEFDDGTEVLWVRATLTIENR